MSAALQGTAIGLLVSLLFSLVPLLEIRRVRPLLLLRDEAARDSGGRPAAACGGGGAWTGCRSRRPSLVLVALVGVAGWQAASLRVGALVSGAFLAVALRASLRGPAAGPAGEAAAARARGFRCGTP